MGKRNGFLAFALEIVVYLPSRHVDIGDTHFSLLGFEGESIGTPGILTVSAGGAENVGQLSM
jgi:hypothetical protein